jgi:hypothetical protein
MTAVLFLIGAMLFGVAVVRRAFAVWTNHAEQIFWGLVVGWILTTGATYWLARLYGRLSFEVVLTILIATWLAAIILWLPKIKNLASSRSLPRLWHKDYAHVVVLLSLFAPLYLALFRTHMLQPHANGGLYSGGKSALYDMAFHAAITNSFVHGANFPPLYTPMPPAPLLYPFLPDFQTALLITLGMELHTALVTTGVLLALALTGIFYFFALRLLTLSTAVAAEARSRFAAALATVLFLLNGGLGFVYFFRDWRASGKTLAAFCSTLETNYANLADKGILWANIIADGLLPQRTSLFGIPLTLIIFSLFAIVWRESGRPASKSHGGRILLGAGVLAGLLPSFHTHSYAAVGLVSGILFLMRPRRVWLAFWLPAVLLALPQLAHLAAHVAASGFAHFQIGWRGHNEPNWLLFWVRNIGLPTLLIIPAWISSERRVRRFYFAFLALLTFSLVLNLSPNDYDNLKLMYYWYAATCVLVAGWLVGLTVRRGWLVLVILAVLVSIASGVLALAYELQSKSLMFSRDEVAVAAFVREQTAPRSLFLTAPSLHQPILSLAGRPIVRGATAWLWSHGYPFAEREGDVRAIYSGRDDAAELLRYYEVDYVYLGSRERQDLKVNQDFFERTLPSVYRSGDITIYDARDPSANSGVTDAPKWLAGYPPREYAARVDGDPFQLLVEFAEIGYALYRYHRVMYGRPPRYDDFMAEAREIGRGLHPRAPNWREILEANQRKLSEAWSERADFKERYDGLTDDQYVATLYSNAGVEPSPRERAELSAALASGKETRASVLRRISANSQFFTRDYNAAYVQLHYFGYLRRDPQDDFWLRDLERTGDFRSLTRAFLESEEYKQRSQ